jgi:hypothetical protein
MEKASLLAAKVFTNAGRSLQDDVFLGFYEINQSIVTFGTHENFIEEIIFGVGTHTQFLFLQ